MGSIPPWTFRVHEVRIIVFNQNYFSNDIQNFVSYILVVFFLKIQEAKVTSPPLPFHLIYFISLYCLLVVYRLYTVYFHKNSRPFMFSSTLASSTFSVEFLISISSNFEKRLFSPLMALRMLPLDTLSPLSMHSFFGFGLFVGVSGRLVQQQWV